MSWDTLAGEDLFNAETSSVRHIFFSSGPQAREIWKVSAAQLKPVERKSNNINVPLPYMRWSGAGLLGRACTHLFVSAAAGVVLRCCGLASELA